ncbi:MAG: creatininase family protein [Lentisphaeria bacterium]|nr:creatininase family protein [Lentisphaeria bacterium]NQZ69016.1 creatininase family protein [Lentisphaeria bacterium]
MDNSLARDSQIQFLRPEEIEARIKNFPAVFVPMGPIEWHGKHLPLGTDALKAHAICVKAAERCGGCVYPPIYFHDGFNLEHLEPLLTELYDKLRCMGFKVIIGISGHNVPGMIDMMNRSLKPVIDSEELDLKSRIQKPNSPNSIAGVGDWEFTLADDEENCASDHAAKWETSDMMFFYPDCVDIAALGTETFALDMSAPYGIGGMDPREHASPELGEKKADLASAAIAAKAQELFEGLSQEAKDKDTGAITPENWWIV